MKPSGLGNRCGHDPRRPRLELDLEPTQRAQPHVINRALERASWLYHDRSLFPELGARKRSERIEAMVLVLRAILRTMDRLTLRSGRVLPNGSVVGFTMVTIGRWARMKVTKRKSGVLTCQRACRALWDLRDAGFVDLTQPIERRKDGKRRGLAGIRQIRMKLFERLDLASRMRRERRELWQAHLKARHVETIAERRRLRRLFGGSARARKLAERTTRQLAEAHAAPAPSMTPDEERARRAIVELAARLERERREAAAGPPAYPERQ